MAVNICEVSDLHVERGKSWRKVIKVQFEFGQVGADNDHEKLCVWNIGVEMFLSLDWWFVSSGGFRARATVYSRFVVINRGERLRKDENHVRVAPGFGPIASLCSSLLQVGTTPDIAKPSVSDRQELLMLSWGSVLPVGWGLLAVSHSSGCCSRAFRTERL
jgi:hypothetical protein